MFDKYKTGKIIIAWDIQVAIKWPWINVVQREKKLGYWASDHCRGGMIRSKWRKELKL